MPYALSLAKSRFSENRLHNLMQIAQQRNKALALAIYMVIIIFTYYILYAPAEEAKICQSSGPSPKRHIQSQSPGGAGSALSGGGVLRCARFGSGQIRDAAPGSKRRCSDQSSRFKLRLFPAFLLQSSSGFPPRGLGRVDRQEARAQGATQAQHGDHGFCGAKANARSFAQSRHFIGTDSRDLWDQGSSPHFGTGSGRREKKPH